MTTPIGQNVPTQLELKTDPITPMKAAIYRAVGAFLALGAGAAIIVYVPDPTMKVFGTGLAGAAILAIEEYIKNQP